MAGLRGNEISGLVAVSACHHPASRNAFNPSPVNFSHRPTCRSQTITINRSGVRQPTRSLSKPSTLFACKSFELQLNLKLIPNSTSALFYLSCSCCYYRAPLTSLQWFGATVCRLIVNCVIGCNCALFQISPTRFIPPFPSTRMAQNCFTSARTSSQTFCNVSLACEPSQCFTSCWVTASVGREASQMSMQLCMPSMENGWKRFFPRSWPFIPSLWIHFLWWAACSLHARCWIISKSL